MKGIAVTPSIDDAKSMARRVRAAMEARGLAATHSDTLELVAAQLGFRDWNTTSAALSTNEPGRSRFTQATPVMLSLDEAQCRAFYSDFLGFEIEFEHRFAANMPVYLALKRGPVQLHLSPHRGDATTGSAVFVWMTYIEDYRRELGARSDGHFIPQPAEHAWGRELAIADPFGNRLRFCERPANGLPQKHMQVDDPAGQTSNGGERSGATASFDVLREVAEALPNVKVTVDKLGIALKMGGEILACTAIHKSAEPDTLMVRLGFDRRDALVAKSPDVFYLTGHYQPYPVVLIRMSRVGRAYLGELLREGSEFVQGEGK
jgi:hypothetical protein